MRVALVYDRLNKIGGAEAVLIEFAKLFPSADWYTSVWNPTRAPFSKNWRVHTSWVSHLPWLRNHHELIPWLMPFVFESFDLRTYDLVISIGSAEAKGVITRPETLHLNYCLTPTRYLYSHKEEYLSNALYRAVAQILRQWDLVAATRPDKMIAISTQVKKRIKNIYKRIVPVIYPPVDTQKYGRESNFVPPYNTYYLAVARLVAYKRLEVLVRAFNQSGKTLVIIGEGSQRRQLERLAGPNVHLLGFVNNAELVGYYAHAKAFLHAGIEDFGIAMCEAQAAGIPVIAYDQGGATDIIIRDKTGLLVKYQTPEAFVQAVDRFETMTFDSQACRKNARRFAQALWQRRMKERIEHYVKLN